MKKRKVPKKTPWESPHTVDRQGVPYARARPLSAGAAPVRVKVSENCVNVLVEPPGQSLGGWVAGVATLTRFPNTGFH